jgi:branched-subunit amino acid ABC-type transport system permease component
LDQLYNGIFLGSIYALFALGFTLVFSVLDILNLAQPAIFALGAFVALFSIESLGLPAALAYATFWAELVGGILLVAGIGTRWVSLALIPILAGAAWVHAGNGWVFSAANGGWEYPAFLIAASIVLALLGDGRYALGNRLAAPNLRLRTQS